MRAIDAYWWGGGRIAYIHSGLHLTAFCFTAIADTKAPKEADDSEGQTPIVSESTATTEVATKKDNGEAIPLTTSEAILEKLATNILKAWPTSSSTRLSKHQVIQALTKPQSKDHEYILSILGSNPSLMIEAILQDQDLKQEKKEED